MYNAAEAETDKLNGPCRCTVTYHISHTEAQKQLQDLVFQIGVVLCEIGASKSSVMYDMLVPEYMSVI